MWYALAFLGSVLLSVGLSRLSANQSGLSSTKPLGKGEFEYPTADASRAISYVAGRVNHSSVNIFYAGQYSYRTIREEVSSGSGMFATSDTVSTGFAYRMRIAFTFCYGPNVTIHGMTSGDFKAFEEVDYVGGSLNVPTTFTIDKPDLYLQDRGGIIANCRFYGGSPDQQQDQTFIDQSTGGHPGYQNVAYLVTDDAYWGNTGSIQTMKWEISRYPDPFTNGFGWERIPDGNGTGKFDANPAYIVFELLNSSLFGAGIATSELVVQSFKDVAEVLFNEGFGLSLQLDTKATARNTIDEIMKTIGGLYQTDPTTGQITLSLIRDSFDVNTIPHYTDDQIVLVDEYGQASLEDLNSEFKVTYTDRYRDYTPQIAHANNAAMIMALNRPHSVKVPYLMVSNQKLANKIAWRELRLVSFAPASLTLTMTREAYVLRRGDVIKISSVQNDIVDLVVRVKSVNYGDALAEHVQVDLLEEVLALGEAAYIEDDISEFILPDPLDPTTVVPGVFFVEPPWIHNFGDHPMSYQDGGIHVKAMAIAPDTNTTHYTYVINKITEPRFYAPFFPLRHITSSTLQMAGTTVNSSRIALGMHTNGIDPLEIYYPTYHESLPLNRIRTLTAISEARMAQHGSNIFMLIDPASPTVMEIVGVGYADVPIIGNTGDAITFSSLSRGLFDTIPKAWPAGTQMWLVSNRGTDDSLQRLLPLDVNEVGIAGSGYRTGHDYDGLIGVTNYTPYGRAYLPICPKSIKINTTFVVSTTAVTKTITSLGQGLVLEWSNASRAELFDLRQETVNLHYGDTIFVEVYDADTNLIILDSLGFAARYTVHHSESSSLAGGLGPANWVDDSELNLDDVLQAGMNVSLRIEVSARNTTAFEEPTWYDSLDKWKFLVDVSIPA